MSILTIPGLRKAKHRGLSVLAGQTPTELKADNARLATDNQTVTEANELLVCELTRAVIRGCQDSMRIAQLETELKAAVTEVRQLQRKTIRDAANLERLRQAVINARPRITYTVQALDRPYVSHVQIPYPVPVGHDMSNETAQNIPRVDLPQQREAS